MLSAQGISWMSSLVAVLFVPRYLGPGDFGHITIAQTLALLVTTLAGLGTTNFLVRQSARNPDHTNALVAAVITLRGLGWAVLTVPCLAIAMVVLSVDLWLPSAITLTGAGFGLVIGTLVAGFQGNHLIGRIAPVVAIIGLVTTFCSGAVLVLGSGLVGFLAVGLAGNAILLTVIGALYVRRFGMPARTAFRVQRPVLQESRSFLSWDLALLLYGKVDILMLGFMVGSGNVGDYALAYKLVSIPSFIPVIAATVLLPELSITKQRDDFRRVLTRSVGIVFVLSAPLCTGLAVLAPEVVVFLAGDESFDRAIPIIAVLAVHLPFVAISTIMGTAMFALDRQRTWSFVAWAAAIINPSFNLVGIPLAAMLWANGALGAALVTLLTELFMTGSAIYFLGAALDRVTLASFVGRTGAACTVGGLALAVMVTSYGPVTALVIGAALFPLLLLGVRVISPGDLRLIYRSARARQTTQAPA